MVFKILIQLFIFANIFSRESSGHLETSSTAFFGASFGLTQLPGGVKPENLMPTLSERPVTLTAMPDAAAATAVAVACGTLLNVLEMNYQNFC